MCSLENYQNFKILLTDIRSQAITDIRGNIAGCLHKLLWPDHALIVFLKAHTEITLIYDGSSSDFSSDTISYWAMRNPNELIYIIVNEYEVSIITDQNAFPEMDAWVLDAINDHKNKDL